MHSRSRKCNHRISLAALACLRGAPDHAQQVAKALEAVDTASEALRALKALLAPEPHREDARASEGAEPAMTSE
jgi:hypothetical protein